MNKPPKSLQNLTESNEPQNLTELVAQLEKQIPAVAGNATASQKQARADAIVNGILESSITPEDFKEDLRNQTWQNNHNELTRVIGKLTGELGRMPTGNMIAEETGLSRQTINKHLKEFYQSAPYQGQISQFRMLSDRLLAKLYKLAMDGDVRAAKVYLDAVGGIPDQPAGLGNGANYIQINNNIKVDQVTFATLPESVQQEITTLILRGLQATV